LAKQEHRHHIALNSAINRDGVPSDIQVVVDNLVAANHYLIAAAGVRRLCWRHGKEAEQQQGGQEQQPAAPQGFAIVA
jgi:hypothetical protein